MPSTIIDKYIFSGQEGEGVGIRRFKDDTVLAFINTKTEGVASPWDVCHPRLSQMLSSRRGQKENQSKVHARRVADVDPSAVATL